MIGVMEKASSNGKVLRNAGGDKRAGNVTNFSLKLKLRSYKFASAGITRSANRRMFLRASSWGMPPK